MCCKRYLCLGFVVIPVMLVGSYGQPPAKVAPSSHLAPAVETLWDAPSSPEAQTFATVLLKELIATRTPRSQVALRVQSHLPQLNYVAEGCFRRDGRRHRLDLVTKIEMESGHRGETVMWTIDDGKNRWHSQQVGKMAPQIMQAASAGATHPDPQALLNLSNGPTALFRALCGHFSWVASERSPQGPVLLGVWVPHIRESLKRGQKDWPIGLPRLCRVFVDEGSMQPIRVDYWGPKDITRRDALLFEIELTHDHAEIRDEAAFDAMFQPTSSAKSTP